LDCIASKGVYCRPTKDKLGKITHKHEPHGDGGVGQEWKNDVDWMQQLLAICEDDTLSFGSNACAPSWSC
jgi:hypothetical protein